jgi:hypothetical protein
MNVWDRLKALVRPQPVPALFERVNALENELRSRGHENAANRLRSTLECASTGLEVHMGLRHALEQIGSEIRHDEELSRSIQALVADVRRALC